MKTMIQIASLLLEINWLRLLLTLASLALVAGGCTMAFGAGYGLLGVGVLLWIDLNRRV